MRKQEKKTKMNILFDLTATQPSACAKYHGGGYYGEVVFFALIKRTNNVIGIYNSKFYINPKILESGTKIYDINNTTPVNIIEKDNIDTFYSSQINNGKEWRLNKVRYIVTWHGVRELELPIDSIAFFYANNLKRKIKFFYKYIFRKILLKKYKNNYKSDNKNIDFITVSEHSRTSIINFYPHLADKLIPVFYSPFLRDEELSDLTLDIELKKYFLLTSSARWEKNNLRAVWAFDELFSQRKDINFKVMLTGVTNKKIFTKKLKNHEKFIFLDYIDRSKLLYLHKNAYAFIFPSLNEGFGYPPIESMRYGVPVAASCTSSIPEICQNAAIYFDPYNISEIKNRIIQLLDKNIYKEYSLRAVERYKIVSERQKQDLSKIIDYILCN